MSKELMITNDDVLNKILRWSTVANIAKADVNFVLMRCREEFPDVRFKFEGPAFADYGWIQALLLHERGVGWGSREGEGQREVQRYAEVMSESAKRRRTRKER